MFTCINKRTKLPGGNSKKVIVLRTVFMSLERAVSSIDT
jgi:hypothetical protein